LDAWRRILAQLDPDGERKAGGETAERREPPEETTRA
jgi:hypothetical protein